MKNLYKTNEKKFCKLRNYSSVMFANFVFICKLLLVLIRKTLKFLHVIQAHRTQNFDV